MFSGNCASDQALIIFGAHNHKIHYSCFKLVSQFYRILYIRSELDICESTKHLNQNTSVIQILKHKVLTVSLHSSSL